ncbi:MAG: hypothetical protein LAO09_23340 [Acidobacteriia bacterium]|nr:hypothetical protein [Terriglobia bacterium]
MIVIADGVQYQPRMATGAFVFLESFSVLDNASGGAILKVFGGRCPVPIFQPRMTTGAVVFLLMLV